MLDIYDIDTDEGRCYLRDGRVIPAIAIVSEMFGHHQLEIAALLRDIHEEDRAVLSKVEIGPGIGVARILIEEALGIGRAYEDVVVARAEGQMILSGDEVADHVLAVAELEVEDIRPLPADQQVIAALAIEPVAAIAAIDDVGAVVSVVSTVAMVIDRHGGLAGRIRREAIAARRGCPSPSTPPVGFAALGGLSPTLRPVSSAGAGQRSKGN